MKLLILSLEKEYHLFIDNYFITLELLFELQEMGFTVTGTIRESRKELPLTVKLKKQRMAGDESEYYICNNFLLVLWKDKMIVIAISTA